MFVDVVKFEFKLMYVCVCVFLFDNFFVCGFCFVFLFGFFVLVVGKVFVKVLVSGWSVI